MRSSFRARQVFVGLCSDRRPKMEPMMRTRGLVVFRRPNEVCIVPNTSQRLGDRKLWQRPTQIDRTISKKSNAKQMVFLVDDSD